VAIPAGCVNDDYERAMSDAMARAREDGVTHVVFGDLYLADVRAYRERMLAGSGIAPLFPLWGRDTALLAREMLDGGLEATVVCVDPRRLPESLAGRAFDRSLLDHLPPGADPCGENGEFHTCVTGGPMFSHAVRVVAGEVVTRDGFVFADLLPAQAAERAARASSSREAAEEPRREPVPRAISPASAARAPSRERPPSARA
jgi:diphthamide synthase (EF-2-diphthine--ammonia ligase)